MIEYNQIGSLENESNSIIELLMVIDENTLTTERSINTLSIALSAVGGMLGFLKPFLRLFLFTIQQTLFTNELLKKIFLVNPKIYGKLNTKNDLKVS